MNDQVYSDKISSADLSVLLNSNLGLEEMILEAIDEVRFEDFRPTIDLDRFETGRAFGPNWEVRWEREGQYFHTVATGDSTHLPACLTACRVDLLEEVYSARSTEYYAWGEWTDGTPMWMEATIPHLFNYKTPPLPGRWRLKLGAIEYVSKQSGGTEFHRLTQTRQEAI